MPTRVALDLGKPETVAQASSNLAWALLHAHMARQDLSVAADSKRLHSLFRVAARFFKSAHRNYEYGYALLGHATVLREQQDDSRHAQRARTLCEGAIAFFGDRASAEPLMEAYRLLGHSARNLGDIAASRAAFEKAVIHADRLGARNVSCEARYQLALSVMLDPSTDMQAKNPVITQLLEEAISFPSRIDIWLRCLELLVDKRRVLKSIGAAKESVNMQRLLDISSLIQITLRLSTLTSSAHARLLRMMGSIYFCLGGSRVITGDQREQQKTAANSMSKAAELFAEIGEMYEAFATWQRLSIELPYADFEGVQVTRDQVDSGIIRYENEAGLDDVRSRLVVVQTKAAVARRSGRLEEALDLYREAIALAGTLPGYEAGDSAKLFLVNRADALIDMKRWTEAYHDLNKALTLQADLIEQIPDLNSASDLTPFESSIAIQSAFFQRPFAYMALVNARLNRLDEAFHYSERSRGYCSRAGISD